MSKKIFILFLILNLSFEIIVLATSSDNTDNSEINNVLEEAEEETENNDTNISNEIYSTSYNNTASTDDESETENETISSYSTISSIPEANLGLNNILNIILITVGVLMILLGIAILIKLKN